MKDLLIVVPYRNREEHLKGFLENSPNYFDQQNITYDILINELDQQGDWNAGLCVNAIVDFINEERQYKYIYIHHVDVWPIAGSWIFPKNGEIIHNLGDYGSCVILLESFLKIGGYSNSFWGWGGEDNDLYQRLKQEGYLITEANSTYPIKYDTTLQNHDRKFNGSNYGNGIKNLLVLQEHEKNNITNFHEHGKTKNLTILKDNIYKQTVIPLKISASETINDKVILAYVKNQTEFANVGAFVKSAVIYAGYSYDIVVFVADEEPSEYFINQISVHGAKCYHHKPILDNLFVDRYAIFKEFLINNPQYKTVLHADILDIYFQADPFKCFDNTKLTVVSEGIKIELEPWNYNTLQSAYEQNIVDDIKHENVVCGGIIGAPRNMYLELAEKIIQEYLNSPQPSLYGICQPILNKVIYKDKLLNENLEIKTIDDDFCINLHVCHYNEEMFSSKYTIDNKSVKNSRGTRFAIVHQYNRFSELYSQIHKYFIDFFMPV